MTRLLSRVRDTLGVRGVLLIIAGVLWIGMGLFVLDNPSPRQPDSVFHARIPYEIRAVMWVASGLFAWAAAPTQRGSRLALRILTMMPLLRCTSYGWSWIQYKIPAPPPGYEAGGEFAFSYLFGIMFVIAIAFTPHGPRPQIPTVDDVDRERA